MAAIWQAVDIGFDTLISPFWGEDYADIKEFIKFIRKAAADMVDQGDDYERFT